MTNEQMEGQITEKQLPALEALFQGATLEVAANAAGVTVQTVMRWKKLPAFQRELQARADAMLSAAQRMAAGEAVKCLETWRELRDDPKQPGIVRIAAADKVFGVAMAPAIEDVRRMTRKMLKAMKAP
jgi:hypothetical protein